MREGRNIEGGGAEWGTKKLKNAQCSDKGDKDIVMESEGGKTFGTIQ